MVTKTLLALMLSFFLTAILQAACICTCDPADRKLCASAYDIDNPCGNVCDNSVSGFTPARTACPQMEVVHPMTGLKVWQTVCVE